MEAPGKPSFWGWRSWSENRTMFSFKKVDLGMLEGKMDPSGMDVE